MCVRAHTRAKWPELQMDKFCLIREISPHETFPLYICSKEGIHKRSYECVNGDATGSQFLIITTTCSTEIEVL